MNWLLFTSMVISAAGGWTMVIYSSYARSAGWPVGEIFTKQWVSIVGGITALGAIYSAFTTGGWLIAVGVFIGGLIFSFLLLIVLKSWSQIVSVGLVVAGYLMLFFVQ